MSLSTFSFGFLQGSYPDDLLFFLKIAENNPLRLGASSALPITTDSVNRPVIGYGYDLIANRGAAISDLTSAGVSLTTAQQNAIGSLTNSTRGIPAGLVGLTLPSEASASALLNTSITAIQRSFDSFLAGNSIALPESCERVALFSMWYQAPGG